MFKYTVIRQATIEENPAHETQDLWQAWDVEARSPKEAVDHVAHVVGEYLVFDEDPRVFAVGEVTELRAIDVTDDQ